jgi:hypothetical protein
VWVPVESLTKTLFYDDIPCLVCHSCFYSEMTYMNAIRMIPFCSKVEECHIWSETSLAKAKHCGFKDLSLGKLSIPKLDEDIDETSDIVKKKSMIIELIEIAYTELILSIDIKASSGKVTFGIFTGYKTKGHPNGNGAFA